jgi:DNA-binding NarL/FixJ family response regulator
MESSPIPGRDGRTPGVIRVLLYEPVPVLAESIALFLGTQRDIDATGVTTIGDLVAGVASVALVLLSIHGWRPEVLGIIQRVRELSTARVLILGTRNHPQTAAAALAGGAHGYVHTRADPVAVLAAVRGVASGETMIVGDGLHSVGGAANELDPSATRLTPREREVIALIAQDLTAQQAASSLGVSVRTVHSHLHHAYRKLGVQGRIGAILAVADETETPARSLQTI